jgi:succinate-semialdehyde dehydrogenase/glutarate-semialdehyde dehydrogenase
MATMSSVNPATGEVLARYEELSDAALEARLARAAQTFRAWRRRPYAERASLLVRAAEVLEQRKEHFARTMTLEMGKTFKSAVAEAEKCALACRFYAENGERFLADEEVKASPLPSSAPRSGGGPGTSAPRMFVRCLPIGPVLAVMPWNFPFWQVFRFAAPALMAGNVGLLKHASNVPGSALAIEEVFRLAGFPDGCFQTLLVGSSRVARILEDDRVVAATLTGSEWAGAAVASTAGKAIKKTVLELGGSDPFVVMPSAQLDAAVSTAVTARCINNGQSCIAAKRFVVHDAIYDRFEREMVRRMAALAVGDPMDPATEVGPLATASEVQKIAEQVDAAVKDGARLLTGGKPTRGKGFYYPPTVLAGIPRSSPSYREELFGPVAVLHRVKDLDQAIEVANDVPFGLGSSVWTNDEAERRRFVDELEAGATFVNAMVASDPRLPFGGVKRSGYGRELAREGIREFVNVKTVVVQELAAPAPKDASE